MNIFLPMTKDRFRLLEDLPYKFNDYVNQGVYTIPKGSIISFRRVDITKMTKVTDTIGIDLRVHFTDPTKTMKMYGGKAQYGIGFSLTYDQVRLMELELAKDVP